jgi:hypothetical protein
VDRKTGGFREFLCTLDKPGCGVSEILAVNDHELLVLERDGTSSWGAYRPNVPGGYGQAPRT